MRLFAKIGGWIGKILGGLIGLVLVLVFIVFALFNATKFLIYGDYYSVQTQMSLNYGLNDGFVPQGVDCITLEDGSERFITTGYMDNKTASRIYVADDKYFELEDVNGGKLNGHNGGIAVHEASDSIFISEGKNIRVFTLSELIDNIDNPTSLVMKKSYPVENTASCISVDGDKVYVGEFYDGETYKASGYKFTSNNQEHRAVLCVYDVNDLKVKEDLPENAKNTSIERISLINKVQGVGVLNNHLYLSTSYGISDSYFYKYEYDLSKMETVIDSEKGLEAKFLDESLLVKELKTPPMSEDICIVGNKVVSLTESSSNKYLFGKLFFTKYIFGLEF